MTMITEPQRGLVENEIKVLRPHVIVLRPLVILLFHFPHVGLCPLWGSVNDNDDDDDCQLIATYVHGLVIYYLV